MKWLAQSNAVGPLRFLINHDQVAGFYFQILTRDVCICDRLQDTLESAMDDAQENFGVPRASWRRSVTDPRLWITEHRNPREPLCSIAQDGRARFHVCLSDGDQKLYDYPAASLQEAMAFALKKFQVPLDSWRQAA